MEITPKNRAETRVLIYSHDSFGLGHLRRCRTIAEALVENIEGASVLIMSGSEVAGSFSELAGIDVMKIPGIIKQADGTYKSRAEGVDVEETMRLRRKLISKTALLFHPDIFIVDKEPMGLRGEVEQTLIELQIAGAKTVLGLRDVMDSPAILKAEWERKQLVPKTAALFDEIWIYGPQDFWNPLQGIEIPDHMMAKTQHVGFINRHREPQAGALPLDLPDNFVLATAGGGGDGEDVMMHVLAAREKHDQLPPLVLLIGPFMAPGKRAVIHTRASALPDVTVIDFVAEPEVLLRRANAIVGMCGYNTFCEILSYDKPALYLPRRTPREEQLVRARRAQELGIAKMLDENEAADPTLMAQALRDLMKTKPPSQSGWKSDMKGLDRIANRTQHLLQS